VPVQLRSGGTVINQILSRQLPAEGAANVDHDQDRISPPIRDGYGGTPTSFPGTFPRNSMAYA
jgi:hypothetical protein